MHKHMAVTTKIESRMLDELISQTVVADAPAAPEPERIDDERAPNDPPETSAQ